MTPGSLERMIADINANNPQGAAPFSWKSIPKAQQSLCGPLASPTRRLLAKDVLEVSEDAMGFIEPSLQQRCDQLQDAP
jgi:hypothetical protein